MVFSMYCLYASIAVDVETLEGRKRIGAETSQDQMQDGENGLLGLTDVFDDESIHLTKFPTLRFLNLNILSVTSPIKRIFSCGNVRGQAVSFHKKRCFKFGSRDEF